MKTTTIVLSLLLVGAGACLAARQAAQTANDAARALCELFATEHAAELAPLGDDGQPDLAGFSPRDFCAIHENVAPFLDEVLRLQRSGARSPEVCPEPAGALQVSDAGVAP